MSRVATADIGKIPRDKRCRLSGSKCTYTSRNIPVYIETDIYPNYYGLYRRVIHYTKGVHITRIEHNGIYQEIGDAGLGGHPVIIVYYWIGDEDNARPLLIIDPVSQRNPRYYTFYRENAWRYAGVEHLINLKAMLNVENCRRNKAHQFNINERDDKKPYNCLGCRRKIFIDVDDTKRGTQNCVRYAHRMEDSSEFAVSLILNNGKQQTGFPHLKNLSLFSVYFFLENQDLPVFIHCRSKRVDYWYRRKGTGEDTWMPVDEHNKPRNTYDNINIKRNLELAVAKPVTINIRANIGAKLVGEYKFGQRIKLTRNYLDNDYLSLVHTLHNSDQFKLHKIFSGDTPTDIYTPDPIASITVYFWVHDHQYSIPLLIDILKKDKTHLYFSNNVNSRWSPLHATDRLSGGQLNGSHLDKKLDEINCKLRPSLIYIDIANIRGQYCGDGRSYRVNVRTESSGISEFVAIVHVPISMVSFRVYKFMKNGVKLKVFSIDNLLSKVTKVIVYFWGKDKKYQNPLVVKVESGNLFVYLMCSRKLYLNRRNFAVSGLKSALDDQNCAINNAHILNLPEAQTLEQKCLNCTMTFQVVTIPDGTYNFTKSTYSSRSDPTGPFSVALFKVGGAQQNGIAPVWSIKNVEVFCDNTEPTVPLLVHYKSGQTDSWFKRTEQASSEWERTNISGASYSARLSNIKQVLLSLLASPMTVEIKQNNAQGRYFGDSKTQISYKREVYSSEYYMFTHRMDRNKSFKLGKVNCGGSILSQISHQPLLRELRVYYWMHDTAYSNPLLVEIVDYHLNHICFFNYKAEKWKTLSNLGASLKTELDKVNCKIHITTHIDISKKPSEEYCHRDHNNKVIRVVEDNSFVNSYGFIVHCHSLNTAVYKGGNTFCVSKFRNSEGNITLCELNSRLPLRGTTGIQVYFWECDRVYAKPLLINLVDRREYYVYDRETTWKKSEMTSSELTKKLDEQNCKRNNVHAVKISQTSKYKCPVCNNPQDINIDTTDEEPIYKQYVHKAGGNGTFSHFKEEQEGHKGLPRLKGITSITAFHSSSIQKALLLYYNDNGKHTWYKRKDRDSTEWSIINGADKTKLTDSPNNSKNAIKEIIEDMCLPDIDIDVNNGLYLEVGAEPCTYQSGEHEVKVERAKFETCPKFCHSRKGGNFRLKSVKCTNKQFKGINSKDIISTFSVFYLTNDKNFDKPFLAELKLKEEEKYKYYKYDKNTKGPENEVLWLAHQGSEPRAALTSDQYFGELLIEFSSLFPGPPKKKTALIWGCFVGVVATIPILGLIVYKVLGSTNKNPL